MKIPLLYGLGMAVGGALLTLIMYMAGAYDSVAAMQSSSWIGIVAGLAIGITALTLAMRAKRIQQSLAPEPKWGYGHALGTGVLTGLLAAIFGFGFMLLYTTTIHTGFSELMYQAQVEKMQANGAPPDRIDAAEKAMRKFFSPLALSLFQAVMGFVWSVILSLIIAIFVRRQVAAPEVDAAS